MKIKESRKMLVQSLGVAAILIAALTACGIIAEPTPTPLPTPLPTIDPDAPGSIHGVLTNEATDQPLANVTVGLVLKGESSGIMIAVEQTGIETETNDAGEFLLEVVPPGEYSVYAIFYESQNMITNFFIVEPGKLLDLGIIPIKFW